MSQASLPQDGVHVGRGEGKSFWLLSDLHTFKVVGDDTNGAFTVAELTAGPELGPPPHIHRNSDESFYILEGQPVLYLDGRAIELKPGACGLAPVGVPHAWRAAGRALWVEMVAPRPRPDGSDTFFLGPAPEAEAGPLDARDPRNHNLFLLRDGEMDLDLLKQGQAMGARSEERRVGKEC